MLLCAAAFPLVAAAVAASRRMAAAAGRIAVAAAAAGRIAVTGAAGRIAVVAPRKDPWTPTHWLGSAQSMATCGGGCQPAEDPYGAVAVAAGCWPLLSSVSLSLYISTAFMMSLCIYSHKVGWMS